MNHIVIFTAGSIARLVSALAAYYADWLFAKLIDGADAGLEFLTDLYEFGCWLMELLSERLCGRQAQALRVRADEWERGLFRE